MITGSLFRGLLIMIFCKYKAIDIEGKVFLGNCWCSSKEELVRIFRDKGLYIIYFKKLHADKGKLLEKRLSLRELSLFCHQFASMLSAGINIGEAINILGQEASNKVIKKALNDIEEMIQRGTQLSVSMMQYPTIFPKFMVNMTSIGEMSGTLENIMERLSDYYSRENVIKNKVIKALSYPCLLLLVCSAVIQILFIYVIPTFVATIGDIGGSLPKSTKTILALSSFLKENSIMLLVMLMLFVATLFYIVRVESISIFLQKKIFTISISKGLAQKFTAVTFSRSIGILLCSGISIVKALDMAQSNMNYSFLKIQLGKCIENVNIGIAFSRSLDDLVVFPPMLCSLVRIGEESGTLADMLIKASKILEEELFNTVEKITLLIEPIIIIFMSIFIGGILISIVSPMFNLMDAI